MIRGFVLSLALLLAGCGGHSNVQVASNGVPATGGPVNVQGRSTLGLLFMIGVVSGTGHESNRQYEMDGTRKVNEQDCSKPIVDWSANLKCR